MVDPDLKPEVGSDPKVIDAVREWLEPLYDDESWPKICNALGLDYHVTSSKILTSRCVFHEERTPSLRMWPIGRFVCYGCTEAGDIADFIFLPKRQNDPSPLNLLKLFGQATERLIELDYDFASLRPLPGMGQLVLEGFEAEAI